MCAASLYVYSCMNNFLNMHVNSLIRAVIAKWKKACWTSIISIFAISWIYFSLQFFESDLWNCTFLYFLFNLVYLLFPCECVNLYRDMVSALVLRCPYQRCRNCMKFGIFRTKNCPWQRCTWLLSWCPYRDLMADSYSHH